MTKRATSLDELDRLDAEDLWPQIQGRPPGPEAGPPVSTARRLTVVLVSVVIVAIGVALPIAALSHDQAPVASDHPIEIGGPTIEGGYINPAHLHGKVVVVGFWASWCAACRSQLVAMQGVADRYGDDRHVAVVGVNVDTNAKEASAFADTLGVSFPSVASGESLAASFGIQTLPTVWVLDQSGIVTGKFLSAYPGPPSAKRAAPLEQQIEGAVESADKGAAFPSSGQGVIEGTLVMVGGPSDARTPVPGQISVMNIDQTGPIVFNVDVGPDGSFSTVVDPGTYQVVGVSPQYHINNGEGTCAPASPNGTVTVTAGEHITVDVECQMK